MDAYVYVVAVVVAMGCWCWENVLVLVKENISWQRMKLRAVAKKVVIYLLHYAT